MVMVLLDLPVLGGRVTAVTLPLGWGLPLDISLDFSLYRMI